MEQLARRAFSRVKWYLKRLDTWAWQNFPVVCQECGAVIQQKNSRKAQTTMGLWATICQKCHEALYPDLYKED